jgi:hypothetical protein
MRGNAMSFLNILYWLCLFLMIIFGGVTYYPRLNQPGGLGWGIGGGFLLFVMLVIIGLRVFPISMT